MPSMCASYAAQYRDGEHRLEPRDFKPYETEYVCLDCGEVVVYYHNQGG